MALVLMLNALSPGFLAMPNTLPQSAGITTPQLIGFVLFVVVYMPFIYWVPPHRIHRLLMANLVVSSATLLGIMAWAVHANGGPGNLLAPAVDVPRAQVGFLMAQGISSVAGTYAGGSDRVSDWTRYARHRHAPTAAQLTALPVSVTVFALVGVVTTSATAELLGGEAEWNPMVLLQTIQMRNYTAACRAGTFFAGAGLLSVTIFINYTQNCVSSGMDMAMLLPRWLSRRRGSLLFAVLGILANPWRFLTQASVFIAVLSAFGVFMSPAAAILVVDFWLVRRTRWNIPDLYRPGGIYWFRGGLNWRAFAAYLLGMAWTLPGFIMAVGGPVVPLGWYRLYQVSFFFGYVVAGGSFYLLNLVWPPPGLGEQVNISLVDSAASSLTRQRFGSDTVGFCAETRLVGEKALGRDVYRPRTGEGSDSERGRVERED